MNSLSSAHSLIRSLNGFRDENTIRLQSESFLRLLFLILLAPFVWSILGYLLFTATGPIGLGFYILLCPFMLDIYYFAERRVQSPQTVTGVPGNRLLGFSEFFFTRRAHIGLCVPVIHDMREEYFEALSQNRIWKARWVRARGTWSFFAAMGLDRFFSVVSLCVKVRKSVN